LRAQKYKNVFWVFLTFGEHARVLGATKTVF